MAASRTIEGPSELGTKMTTVKDQAISPPVGDVAKSLDSMDFLAATEAIASSSHLFEFIIVFLVSRLAIPPDCPQKSLAVGGRLWTPVAYLYYHNISYCGICIRLIEITKWDECLRILDISRSPKSAGRRIFPAWPYVRPFQRRILDTPPP